MIYEQLDDIAAAVRTGLSVVTTVGEPDAETPPGVYAFVEPADNDEEDLGNNVDHAVGGMLRFRVFVCVTGVSLQDKLKVLCDYVDRSKSGSVQRALLGADFAGRLTVHGSQWGTHPGTNEFSVSVTGSVLLLPDSEEE